MTHTHTHTSVPAHTSWFDNISVCQIVLVHIILQENPLILYQVNSEPSLRNNFILGLHHANSQAPTLIRVYTMAACRSFIWYQIVTFETDIFVYGRKMRQQNCKILFDCLQLTFGWTYKQTNIIYEPCAGKKTFWKHIACWIWIKIQAILIDIPSNLAAVF